jgi:predicted component of type VI protein secretion system
LKNGFFLFFDSKNGFFSEIVEETRQKLSEMEGDRVDPKARVEFLKNIESALNKEREAEEDAEERAEKSKIKIDIDGIESKLNEQLDASERAEELEEAELAQRELEKMRKEVKKLDEKISGILIKIENTYGY